MQNSNQKLVSAINEALNSVEDANICKEFEVPTEASEAEITVLLLQINEILASMGVPHIFILGFNTGSQKEFITHTHTVGSYNALATLLQAAAIQNSQYEKFLISVGEMLKSQSAKGELTVKRAMFNKKIFDEATGQIDPDNLLSMSK